MRAPILESLSDAHLPRDVEGAELFRVVQPGWFAGRDWASGEVLMCRGEPRSGDSVVLVARGRQGRPRVGRVEGTRFLGEVGEPCHPSRWRASGRVVAAWSPRGDQWDVALVSARGGETGTGRGQGEPRHVPTTAAPDPLAADPGQLSLFATAA